MSYGESTHGAPERKEVTADIQRRLEAQKLTSQGSMTYGDLVQKAAFLAAEVEPHVWDNMNIAEQRDWLLHMAVLDSEHVVRHTANLEQQITDLQKQLTEHKPKTLVEVPQKRLQIERDDAMFALQALCEELNALHTGHVYRVADCIQGAVDMREYCVGRSAVGL